MQTTQQSKPELLEKLAALDLWKWQSWLRYVFCGKFGPDKLKEMYCLLDVKYEDLTEEQKENYRFWARKTLEIMKDE